MATSSQRTILGIEFHSRGVVPHRKEVRLPSLAHYMAQYDHEHSSGWNKLLHGVGIPMIFAGIILLILMKWIWGASFFVGVWIFSWWDTELKETTRRFFKDRFICW